MKTASSWCFALCLAIGLLVCFAGPLRAALGALDRPFQQGFIMQAAGSPFAATRNLINPGPAAQNEVGLAEEFNRADRAGPEKAQRPQAAVTSNDEPAAIASNDHSLWDKTSLIGKIFIGIGTLLTLASAARLLLV